MKLAKLNIIVDVCAGVFCTLSVITGFLQWFIYPHQGPATGNLVPSHGQLYNLHLLANLTALLFILIHLGLHLKWIENCAGNIGQKSRNIKLNFGADIAGTVFGFTSLVSGVVLWLVYPLEPQERGESSSLASSIPGGMKSISMSAEYQYHIRQSLHL